ncbi:MAG: GNAT family N-acetyltransferase [Clostridia bacterium]|nr:GNAT family N-acetyltransferase [Clostridia bacterium]
MELRYLKTDEFYHLRDLLDGVFSRKYGRETKFEKLFPRFFTEPNEYVTSSHIGMFDGDRLAGTAALYPLDYVIGEEHIKLYANGNVAVHEDYRGQGIMSTILKEINNICDDYADLCYLHGDPIRYGRFGYYGGGQQYVLTIAPEIGADYSFEPMKTEESEWLNSNVNKRSDYVLRKNDDLLPALCSGNRKATTVYGKSGEIVGYISLGDNFVEEFAFNDKIELDVFRALARRNKAAVKVRLSGYDLETLARLRDYAKVEISEPAMFRIINPDRMKEVAIKMGLPEDTLYAPYLT